MSDSIKFFLSILIFAVPVGFAIYAFIVGKFPVKSTYFGSTGNYVVWGDQNVDPKLLTKGRARFLSILFLLIFGAIILALVSQSTLDGNAPLTDIISISIGIIVGIILCRKMISL